MRTAPSVSVLVGYVKTTPRQAWDEKLGCQWGRECGECQRASDLETPDVSKVLEGHDVQVERQQYSDAHNSHFDKKSTH